MTTIKPPIRKVVIVGGTGLIGKSLVAALKSDDCEITLVSRNANSKLTGAHVMGWDSSGLLEAISQADAVVNLAGESLGTKRWNPDVKESLRRSRIETTRKVVTAIRQADCQTRLVNASAIGFYGDTGDRQVDETSPIGSGYLAELCRDWEAEAMNAAESGSTVALARIGVVFSPDGGALQEMTKPFRLCVGGPLASGRQWVSWIHSTDVANALVQLCRADGPTGPVNLTSPHAIRNADLAKEIGACLHRPAFIRAPALALRMVLGEFAEALIGGQNVVPAVLTSTGFEWRFPTIQSALQDAIGQ